MNYVKDIKERKALLTRIIPLVPQSGGRWGKKLDWTKYMAGNPMDAVLLGYDQRDKKPELWNRNNVLARDMLNRGAIKPESNGFGFADTDMPKPLKGTSSGLLDDVQERTQLLLEIFPQLESGPSGAKSWKGWFETHPEHATALGYDIRQRKPKIWAANLRISQGRQFRREMLVPQTPHIPLEPYKVETIETDDAARQVAARLTKLEFEKKNLKDQLTESEIKLSECRSQLNAAKEIVFDLTLQLRELRS